MCRHQSIGNLPLCPCSYNTYLIFLSQFHSGWEVMSNVGRDLKGKITRKGDFTRTEPRGRLRSLRVTPADVTLSLPAPPQKATRLPNPQASLPRTLQALRGSASCPFPSEQALDSVSLFCLTFRGRERVPSRSLAALVAAHSPPLRVYFHI